MRSSVRHVQSVIVLAFVAVAATGCSHNTLDGGSQDITLKFSPRFTSPEIGPGRYEAAKFSINRIQALPADPAAAALFGTERLLFAFDPFDADLTKTQDVAFSHIALSSGTYRVTLIEFTKLALNDNNITLPPASCIEGVAVLDGSQPAGVPTKYIFNDPPELTFTIQPGQTTLAVAVEVNELIKGYESAYTCQLGCGSGGSSCLTAFDQSKYKAALLANVTIE